MTREPDGRAPAWRLLIAAGVACALFAVGVLLRIAFEDLPAPARPEILERRFQQQIAFLRDLAETYPAPECRAVAMPDEAPGGARLVEMLRYREEWDRLVRDGAGLLGDPAILGASLLCYLPDGTVTLDVKPFDEPEMALSRDLVIPRDRRGKASLWHSGGRRFVRYEDRIGPAHGVEKGFALFLDADRLDGESP